MEQLGTKEQKGTNGNKKFESHQRVQTHSVNQSVNKSINNRRKHFFIMEQKQRLNSNHASKEDQQCFYYFVQPRSHAEGVKISFSLVKVVGLNLSTITLKSTDLRSRSWFKSDQSDHWDH